MDKTLYEHAIQEKTYKLLLEVGEIKEGIAKILQEVQALKEELVFDSSVESDDDYGPSQG